LQDAATRSANTQQQGITGTTSAINSAVKGLSDPVAQLIASLAGGSSGGTAFGMDADLAKSLGLI
jgi:hypothetical protein